jgi:ubiquinone/menaquinone biosynthesis C-methylase UbiE
MKPLDQAKDLQAYYRDPTVVNAYLERRTAQPFNGFLHRAQVRFLNDALRECAPRRVLEIAPGPARLSAELDPVPPLVVIDASAQMLAVARRRLEARRPGCGFLQGDAFRLPFADHSFDFVFVLKLIRHFQIDDRMRLYAEIRRVLRPQGALVLDAQNRAVSQPHRERKGLEHYRIYDVLYDFPELERELEAAGFGVRRVEGIARHFTLQRGLNRLRRFGLGGMAGRLISLAEGLPGGLPSTWMLLTQARP